MEKKIPININKENKNIEILSLKEDIKVRKYKKPVEILIIKNAMYLILKPPFSLFINIIADFIIKIKLKNSNSYNI
jgi:hypothetical protein